VKVGRDKKFLLEQKLSKDLLRNVILGYRKSLNLNDCKKLNRQLIGRIHHFLKENKLNSIHVFLPIRRNNEPDITKLLDYFWDNKIKVVVSKTDFRIKKLTHFEVNKDTILAESKMGIPEPVEAKQVGLSEVDIIFVPFIVADKEGNRIGYGGGYYDQLLSETKALKVGLSLSPLLDKIKQIDEWDKPLDIIITPKQTWQKQH